MSNMLVWGLIFLIIIVALFGYYNSIKISPLEKDIRKHKLDYECYECKNKFSVNKVKCPECGLITLYGVRKKNYWKIIPIILISFLLVAKFFKLGMFD